MRQGHAAPAAATRQRVATERRDTLNSTDPGTAGTRADSVHAGCPCGGRCPRCTGVQARLRFTQPNDPLETEADRLASAALSGTPATGMHPVHAHNSAVDRSALPDSLADALKTPGERLEPGLRGKLESGLGVGLDGVRVHRGAQAERAADSIQAEAFTHGHDMVFAAGRYQPHLASGQHLIAHEVVHTLQQGRLPAGTLARLAHTTAEKILQELIRKPGQDGEEGKRARLRALFEATPDTEARALHARLSKVPTKDDFVVYFRAQVDEAARREYLGILEKKLGMASAAAATPAAAASSAAAVPAAAPNAGPLPLAQRKASDIMADPAYIDNGIARVESEAGEYANIDYANGDRLRIGLLPETVGAPFEGVDYRTLASEHGDIADADQPPGKYEFIPRGAHIRPPDGATYGDVLDTLKQSVSFQLDATSHRIVPSLINSRTAPTLCACLRKLEADYEELAQATSQGGVKVFKMFENVLLIAGLLPTGGSASALAKGAATRQAGTVLAKRLAAAEQSLLARLLELLKSGQVGDAMLEAVNFGNLRATRNATELIVEYTHIQRIAGVAGEGGLTQAALERAAVAVAKQQGMTTTSVRVALVENPKWASFLESQGYVKEMLTNATGNGWTTYWHKTLPLP